jgi:small GTP-binding protein
MESDINENLNFVKFHKINIFGNTGVGKKTLLKEFNKFNNPNYSEKEFEFNNENEINDSQKIIEQPIQQLIIPLENEKFLYLNIYITNLDDINFIKDKNKYILYNSEIIVLMIDITNSNSFQTIKQYLEFIIPKNDSIEISNFNENIENKQIILLANKMDLDSDREVGSYELNQLNELYSKLKLIEISLKKLDNFEELLNMFHYTFEQESFKLYNIVKLKEPLYIPKNVNIQNVDSLMTIFLLGSSGVGKTSFIGRFFSNVFNSNTLSTLGLDVEKTIMKINDKICRLEVWDTAGQERLRSIPKKFYIKGDIFILMFDITNKKSFLDLNQWIKDICESRNVNNNDISNDTTVYLIGNKIDDIENRKVESEDAENMPRRKIFVIWKFLVKMG